MRSAPQKNSNDTCTVSIYAASNRHGTARPITQHSTHSAKFGNAAATTTTVLRILRISVQRLLRVNVDVGRKPIAVSQWHAPAQDRSALRHAHFKALSRANS